MYWSAQFLFDSRWLTSNAHQPSKTPIASHEFRQHPPCHHKFCRNTTGHVLDNWHVAYIHHPQGSWWQARPIHNCKDPHSTKPRHTIPGPFQVSVLPERCQVSGVWKPIFNMSCFWVKAASNEGIKSVSDFWDIYTHIHIYNYMYIYNYVYKYIYICICVYSQILNAKSQTLPLPAVLAAHVVSVIVPGLTISCKVGGVIDRGIGIQLHRRLAIQTSETHLVSEQKMEAKKKTNETKVTNEYLNIQLSKGDVRNINNYINCWNCADVRYSELHVLKRSNVGFWPPNIKVSPIGIPIMNGTQEDRHRPTMTNWSGWIIWKNWKIDARDCR